VNNKENFNPNIVPSSGKRIISDVIVTPQKEIASRFFREPNPIIKPRAPKRRIGQKKAFFSFMILLVFLLGWGTLGARMEVILSPKIVAAPVDKALALTKIQGNGKLVFRTLSLPDARSGEFKATEKKSQESRAEGIVVIFNKAKESQVLIASTRLESSDGKIYRIPRTIVVPASKQEGGKTIPGSVEITVMADKTGNEYNLGLSDFTLPGLKGSPKYELVFGRSKTEMRGGASGEQTVVGKSDVKEAAAQLFLQAGREAANLLLNKIPPGEFLLPPSAEYAALNENLNPAVGAIAERFKFTMEGEVKGATVSRGELEKALFKDSPVVSGLDISKLRIKNLDKLDIKIIGYKFEAANFNALISGKMEIEGVVEPDAVKSFLEERAVLDADSVLSAFPELARAELRLRPFLAMPFYRWLRRVPTRIDIVLE